MNGTIEAIGRDRFMDGAINGITVGGNVYSVPFEVFRSLSIIERIFMRNWA